MRHLAPGTWQVFGEADLSEALEALGLWPTCTLFTKELDDDDDDE